MITARFFIQFRFLLLLGLLLMPTLARSESAHSLVEAGTRAYEAGRYDEALALYDRAATMAPNSAPIAYNRGNALFRQGKYPEAAKAFAEAAAQSGEPNLTAGSLYNLGNSEFKQGETLAASDLAQALKQYQASVDHFRRALETKPDLTVAGRNLEMARRGIEAVEQKLKQQAEAAKTVEKLAAELKQILEKQKGLATTGQELANAPAGSDAARDQTPPLIEGQESLRQESEQLAADLGKANPPDAPPGSPLAAAKDKTTAATKNQEQAVSQLKGNELPAAAKSQQEAAANLQDALDALQPKKKKDQDKQQADQKKGGEKQEQKQPGDQQEEKQGDHEKKDDTGADEKKSGDKAGEKNKPDEGEKQPSAAAEPGDNTDKNEAAPAQPPMDQDAKELLKEEAEHRLLRQLQGRTGEAPVDKDW